jgi:hypothetical protein
MSPRTVRPKPERPATAREGHRESIIVDRLAPEGGQSANTHRASNSFELSTIEEFRDLKKLG